MKRGDYVPPTSGRGVDQEANALVDFDRKWADGAAVNGEGEEEDDDDDTTSSSVGGDSDGDGDGETVEYEDEFGRLRRGTKADAAKEIRRNKARSYAASELREYSARPQRPDRLIHGDAIQTAAFDPDATIAAQMESLARKRDRSPTPPESVHYDASKEVRSKGVGFYAFSRDGETRKGEMEALERERGETEKRKREREAQKERRRKEVVERKRVIAEKRDRKEADRFLETL